VSDDDKKPMAFIPPELRRAWPMADDEFVALLLERALDDIGYVRRGERPLSELDAAARNLQELLRWSARR
jgi:hypothetical protein